MIFNSIRYEATSYVNEAELDEILENAPDRFKYETMSEATARVIGEQEVNWGRLMVGVGIGELVAMQEHGLEFINESGRIQAFIDKFVAYIKMAINKLAEITKSFIAKLSQFVLTTDAFVKRYEKDIKRVTDKMLDGVEFNGYPKFNHSILNAKYEYTTKNAWDNADISTLKAAGSKEEGDKAETYAKQSFFSNSSVKYSDDDNFTEKVTELLFGDTEKETFDITKGLLSEQLTILKETKKLKDQAKKNYKSAASKLQNIIKNMEKAADKVEKSDDYKDDKLKDAGVEEKDYKSTRSLIEDGFRNIASYHRHYAQAATTFHGIHMRALSARSKQAKAICTKAVQRVIKNDGQTKRNQYRKGAGMDAKVYESYDSTAFLGAVEFI